MRLRRAGTALFVMSLLVAACGGGTNPPAATQGGGGGGGATTPPATQGAVASQGPVATQGGGGGTGGGEFTGGPCSLLTADDVAGIVGGSGWVAAETPMAGGSGGCIYQSANAASLAATTVTSGVNSSTLWGVYSTLPATEIDQVSGIADGAVWVKSSATLFFLKGQTLVGISAGTGNEELGQRLDWAKAMAGVIVGKL